METRRVSLTVDGLNIAGELYLPEQGQKLPGLCLCHGIPAAQPDPSDRGYPLLAETFAAAGFVTLIFNFRGCGESEGNLDMLGWSRDLDAVLSYLSALPEVDSQRLSVLGFSGGAAVSVYQAAHDERIQALVICACPASFVAIAEWSLEAFLEQCRQVGSIREPSFPPSPEAWAEGFARITPADWVHCISPRPLLIVHGDRDEVVHPGQGRELYDRAREPKELVIISGGEHRLRQNKDAMDTVLGWLTKVNRIEG